MRDEPAGGHHVRPHTADVIIEAWGPSRTACLEETVRGMVSAFADTTDVVAAHEVPFELGAVVDVDVVVALLGEVLYLLDADGWVVVDVTIEEGEDGDLFGTFYVAPCDAVDPVGAVPKGVSHSELSIGPRDSEWECRVIVDV